MTTLTEALAFVRTTLEASTHCKNVAVLEAIEYSFDQFRLRVRANLGSGIKFQAPLYYNRTHVDYAYQVFSKTALLRWDNKEEYPEISTFPHHHHNLDAKVVASPLSGNPEKDLRRVLEWITRDWDQIHQAKKDAK